MSQHDYSIANQGFPATRADINNVLSAIATNNSGTSAPSTQYAGQFWIDTTTSTWTLYIHDGADDIQFATIDTSANTVNFIDSALASDVVINTSGDITTTGAFTSVGIDDNATSTAITIDSSENVGINTSSPNALLDIDASSRNAVGDLDDPNDYAIVIRNPSTNGYGNGIAFTNDNSSNVGGAILHIDKGSNNLGDLAFYTNPNSSGNPLERMRIVSIGGVNVGSGVISSASTDGNIVVDEGIYIGTFNGDNQIRSSSAGGGSATLYIGNAAIQVSSDERLKTNIADTTMSAVDKIKQVRIVDFNWNDPSDTSYNNRNARGTWTGVIAQELINVFPFAVNAPRNEEDLSIDTESEKKWQVDQAHLVPVLMKAIQEQQTKIEQLEARITALENN